MERESEGVNEITERAAPRPDAAPLRAIELLVVALVWGFYAVLTVASVVLDRHEGRVTLGALFSTNPRFYINPVIWAVLTTLVLWFGRRVSLDRVFWKRRWPLVLIACLLVAKGTDMVSDALWDAFAPREVVERSREHEREERKERERKGREQHRLRPGFENFTWLDDFVVLLSALAAASARGWVLRERDRREASRQREALLRAESERARADSAQLEAQLAEARLDALRRQLDPHFLFNTLNAVSALVERDPRGVRRMIGQLSDLLRHSMDGASVPEVPLRAELDLLERYVDIMRVRFENLAIETRADPRTLDALVPNLILQPLVENAIRHGIEPRAEGGRVVVETLLDGDTLVLRVHDDGAGRVVWPPQGGAGRGVGLRNTEARLAQLYGTAQRLTVGPDPAGGMLAEVHLPYHTSAEGVHHGG
jgi:two-component sensor histidine kinase